MTAKQARTRFLVLLGLRWLPTGLVIPILVLLPLDRGLSLTQIGLFASCQGLMVLLLELPTGGFADALGRRPVLIGATVVALFATVLFLFAGTFWLFAVVYLLQGVYRALDSGPLESWYVDAVLAADPDARLESGLGAGGLVTGLAIAGGSLASGGLVAWAPVPGVDALAVPVLGALLVQAVGLLALVVLLREPRRPHAETLAGSIRRVPAMIGAGVGLLRRSRVLAALITVELSWGFGMVTFETLFPVRLTELLGDADRAGAVLGPVGAAAWVANALGSVAAVPVAKKLGTAPTAALMRLLQAGTVVGMGLLAGPAGVIVAYLACYVVHGASNPLHMALLHRQVDDGAYRTTVMSLNSMVGQPAAAIGLITLTALADGGSTGLAMVVGAVVLALAAPLYLPAWRASRQENASPVPVISVPNEPSGTMGG